MTFAHRAIGLAFALLVVLPAGVAAQHGHGAPSVKPPAVKPAKAGPSPKAPASTIGARIAARPQLAAKLTPLLPKGMTLETAANGFRNQGQFIAALHVSKNLGLPFASLKTEMTGADRLSLGKAIQKLRPTADAKTATKQAEKQADDDVKSSDK
ncbi:MAG TPA: hypothetical protein VL309_09115 [Vicinamibacterales bacterium]|jgi:hypothetical protein|nr:hypothetical protein [Vicinamibacterales bacterium]